MTTVCARAAQKRRGAKEIAHRSRVILAPFRRRVLDIDLDVLLDSMNDFIKKGEGPILLQRQG